MCMCVSPWLCEDSEAALLVSSTSNSMLKEVAVCTHCPSAQGLQARALTPELHVGSVLLFSPPGKWPGQCPCKEGYAGDKCDRCQFGYRGFPDCAPCDCSTAGSTNDDPCTEPCLCKVSVAVKEALSLFSDSLLHWLR